MSTQAEVGPGEGLKKESSIHCDNLVSLPKSVLTNYVGSLRADSLRRLEAALVVALGLDG